MEVEKRDRELLAQKYRREFEIALVKICMLSASIGFAAGVVIFASLMLLVK